MVRQCEHFNITSFIMLVTFWNVGCHVLFACEQSDDLANGQDQLAKEMTHDLEMNFNKIAPYGLHPQSLNQSWSRHSLMPQSRQVMGPVEFTTQTFVKVVRKLSQTRLRYVCLFKFFWFIFKNLCQLRSCEAVSWYLRKIKETKIGDRMS